MPMSPQLMNAILAMDSYNRGYGAGLTVFGNQLGKATLGASSTTILGSGVDSASGFYAQTYTWGGKTIISYRGTDTPALSDIFYGWTLGTGFHPASQATLATQFYQEITGQTLAGGIAANTVLTGHSLGGGLAGYIAALTGTQATIFDHMPYGNGAILKMLSENSTLGLTDFLGLLQGQIPQGNYVGLPLSGSITAISVLGEVLTAVRAGAPAALLALAPFIGPAAATLAATYSASLEALQTNISLSSHGGLRSPVDLHSQALLVTLLWASEKSHTNWQSVGAALLDALFDPKMGQALHLTNATGNAGASDQMMRMIAYSAIEESGQDQGLLPFGNKAIRALFDDANEVGRLATSDGVAQYLTSANVQKALMHLSIEYAGLLARNAETDSANPQDTTGFEKGALHYDSANNRLIGDFSRDMWEIENNTHMVNTGHNGTQVDIVGKKTLADAVLIVGSIAASSSVEAAVAEKWGGNTDHIISLVAATKDATAELSATTDGKVGEGEDARPEDGAMLVGAGGNDKLTGAKGKDLLVGGIGKDAFIGGRGDDLMFGGAGDDAFRGYQKGAPEPGNPLSAPPDDPNALGYEGNDWIDGGAGNDTADYSRATTGVRVTLGAENGKINGTNTVKVTDDGTGGQDRLLSIEKIVLSSAKDTVTVKPFEGRYYQTLTGDRPTLLVDMGSEPLAARDNPAAGDTLDFSQYGKGLYLKAGQTPLGKGYELFVGVTFSNKTGLLFTNVEHIIASSGNDEVIIKGAGRSATDLASTEYTNTGPSSFHTSPDLDTTGALQLDLGAGNDTLKDAPWGTRVETGDGADTIWFKDGLGIADLSGQDRIKLYGGWELHGGRRYLWSDSAYATSMGGLAKWGINKEGELVIEVKGLGTMYILNWGASGGMGASFEQRPGQISVFEFDIGAFRLLDPKPSHMTQMGTWDLFGAIMKTEFGASVWKRIDPLTLDLDGDGLELTSASSIGPRFDIDGDFYGERTGWVKPDDGLLVRDLDGDGVINDVTEMFGGRGSGFTALSTLDGNDDGKVDAGDDGLADFNGDGVVDSSDSFAALQVWRDFDQDGVTDADELFSLGSLGIISISVDATEQEDVFVNGNQVAATASYTRADGSTGTIADVWYNVDNINTIYNGAPIAITAQAEALPEHKGFGTLLSLRQAMSLVPTFATTVAAVLPTLGELSIEDLRAAVLPLFRGWALASPLGDGDTDPATSAPQLAPHNDVHIRVIDGPFGKDQVVDFAYQTVRTYQDSEGVTHTQTYWRLASSATITSQSGTVIEYSSLQQVLDSPQTEGRWITLDHDLISFVERYIGEALPVDTSYAEGQAPTLGALPVLTSILETADMAAIRIAVQGGPLAPFFSSIVYDPAANNFHAAPDNERELIPVFEAIFTAAKTSGATTTWIGEWKPLLDYVIGDYVRENAYLLNTYSFLTQNIVAAYENVDLGLDLHAVAVGLGIPGDLLQIGSGTLTGTADGDILIGGAGNDLLRGGKGPDSYIFGEAIGHDVIHDIETPVDVQVPDMIRFAHLAPADVSARREGLDLILTVTATGETVTVIGQFAGHRPGLFGGNLIDDTGVGEIVFADGTVWGSAEIAEAVRDPRPTSDIVLGTPSVDFLDGGAGDDVLSGGDDTDYYYFGLGYGHDTISEDQTFLLVAGPDLIHFGEGIAREDLVFTRVGNSVDLHVGIDGAPDVLTVLGQFDASYTGPFATQWFDRVEVLTFADGDYVTWQEIIETMVADAKTEGDDSIYGFDYEDVIDGGVGNDFLSGGNENDTYIFGTGYGHDVIDEALDNILSGMTDRVSFTADVAPADVSFKRLGSSLDLQVTLASGDTLVIENQFDAFSSPFGLLWFGRIEQFEFAAGEILDHEDVILRVLAEAKTAGDDAIYGFFREDVLDGGAGNDFLAGGSEGDTYIWDVGYGHDVIHDLHEGVPVGDKVDRVTFGTSVMPSDLRVSRGTNPSDLILTHVITGETLVVRDQFSAFAFGGNVWEIEEFQFADGTVWTNQTLRPMLVAQAKTAGDDTIIGFQTADVLDGGAGTDTLRGGGGGDTYVFGRGYGHDTVDAYIVYVTWNLPDTLQFNADVAPEDLLLSRSGDDLTLTIAGTDDKIKIVDQFSGLGYWTIESFSFANGTTWTWQDVQARLMIGTSGDDTLTGFTTANYFDGGAGNDLLIGSGGGDTFAFDVGYGVDTIDAYIGSLYHNQPDTVEFGAGITASMLQLARSGDDLIINVTGTGDQLRILSNFTYRGYSRIENYSFADGAFWTWEDVQLALLQSTSGDDALVGYDGDDILDGGAGNDLLKGRHGHDTYVFGRGYGQDVINDDNFGLFGNAPDRLVFKPGIAVGDLEMTRVGDDLVIRIAGTTDRVTIYSHFNDYYQIANFEFADGTVLIPADILAILAGNPPGQPTHLGSEGDDTLVGTSGQDVFDGLGGNDVLKGGDSADAYLFGIGSGNDRIEEGNGPSGEDVLRLIALNPVDIELFRTGNNLHVGILASGETMTVKDHFVGTAEGIEKIKFTDGSVLDRAAIRDLAVFRGTSGADLIVGTTLADTIDGRAGGDTLRGGAGSDLYLYGAGAGNDTVIEDADGAALDTVKLVGLDSADVTLSRNGANLFVTINATGEQLKVQDHFVSTTAGIERLLFDDGSAMDRAQILYALAISGTADNDTLTGTTLQDVIFGLGGNDTISGVGADDRLEGWEGADTLYGNYGDDVLVGGTGNDTLSGDSGNDTYMFALGDGQDIVRDYGQGSSGGDDKIVFGAGIAAGNLVVTQSVGGHDLIIDIAGTSDRITIQGGISSSYDHRIEQVRFADGSVMSHAALLALSLTPTAGNDALYGDENANTLAGGVGNDTLFARHGNDTITGGVGNDTLSGDGGDDTYVFTLGDGQDIIRDYGTGSSGGFDTIQFGPGIAAADLIVTQAGGGNDFVISIANTSDRITIQGGVNGGADFRIEQIRFDGGAVLSHAEILALSITPTTGNDVFHGDESANQVAGGAGADTLFGRHGNDTLTGGTGNDTLSGDGGDDTYVFGFGDGQDIVRDWGSGSSGGFDTIQFAPGVTAADLVVSQGNNGNDLVLSLAGGADRVTIQGGITDSYDFRIEQVRFDNGSLLSYAQLMSLAVTATAGNDVFWGDEQANSLAGGAGRDKLIGRGGGDTYAYTLGDGADTVDDQSGSGGDTLVLHGIAPADVVVVRSANNAIFVVGPTQAGRVSVINQFSGASGVEQVVFDDGTVWSAADVLARATTTSGLTTHLGSEDAETIEGTAGADIIDGAGGTDTLRGGAGGDTYRFGAGMGNDTVIENSDSGAVDKLQLVGLSVADVTLGRSGEHLSITVNATGERITIQDHFYSTTYGVEQLLFADGTIWDRATIAANAPLRGTSGNDTIYGTAGNDTFIGGLGNDTIRSGTGSDTHIYASGDGNDLIDEESSSTVEVDKLNFTDLNAADISLVRSGGHLRVNVTATGHQITLEDQYWSTSQYYGIERFEFADGSFWTRDQIFQNTWLIGTSGNETINGWSAIDNIDGGAGNDTLVGGSGDDTYRFGIGSGSDTIDENNANGVANSADRVLFGAGIAATDVRFARSGNGTGNDLVITITGQTDVLTIRDGLWSDTNNTAYDGDRVDFFDFADGTRITIAQAEAATLIGTGANETLTGFLSNDILDGAGGNDTLSAGAGNDVVIGGAGNDSMTGATGNDTFVFHAGFGQDTVVDFTAGAGSQDVIELHDAMFADFAAVQAASAQVGSDVRITLDASNTITLKNVTLANLHQDDFLIV